MGKKCIEVYLDFFFGRVDFSTPVSCVTVGPIRAESGSQGDDQPPTQHNDGEERVIFVNAPHQPAKYKNNHITTAKYSFLSFIPLFLFEQFRRYSNCFFLFIALMQVSLTSQSEYFEKFYIRYIKNVAVPMTCLTFFVNLNLANTGRVSDRTLDDVGPADLHPQRVRSEGDSRGCCTYF